MFGSGPAAGLWSNFAKPVDNFLEKPRSAPARATMLEFPKYHPPHKTIALSQSHMNSLRQFLICTRRPSDVQDNHVAQLNIRLSNDIPMSNIIPEGKFETRPLPYDKDLNAMLTELQCDNQDAFREVLRLPPLQGRTKPRLAYARNFFTSLEDMSHYWDSSADNYFVETSEVNDQTKQDCTDISGFVADEKHSREKFEETKMDDEPSDPACRECAAFNSNVQPTKSSVTTMKSQKENKTSIAEANVVESSEKLMYTGHRLGAGHQMPPGLRVAAVRNLLKMVIYKFNCRDHDISPRERLQIKDINIPPASIMCHFDVSRIPQDVKLAKLRIVEGPIIGVCCRSEVRWKDRGDTSQTKSNQMKIDLDPKGIEIENGAGDFVGEKFDLLREIGAMLFIAAQRAREDRKMDKEENKKMKNSWWMSKPRWGGGPTKWGQLAYEVYEDEDPTWSPEERRLQMEKRKKDDDEKRNLVESPIKPADLSIDDLIADSSPNRPPKKRNRRNPDVADTTHDSTSDMHAGRRIMHTAPTRKKWYQDWLQVRPNSSTWDEKVIYKRVGRDGKFDDVYQISSLNHHVCLMRMSVHPKYLEWLETGEISTSTKEVNDSQRKYGMDEEGEQSESILAVSRTKWFDLFDIEQRKEFLIGVWRLMSWINRDEIPKTEYDKMEEAKQAIVRDKQNDINAMDTST